MVGAEVLFRREHNVDVVAGFGRIFGLGVLNATFVQKDRTSWRASSEREVSLDRA